MAERGARESEREKVVRKKHLELWVLFAACALSRAEDPHNSSDTYQEDIANVTKLADLLLEEYKKREATVVEDEK